MLLVYVFNPIIFIFQGSPENLSMTLNNFKNTFPAAALGQPLTMNARQYNMLRI